MILVASLLALALFALVAWVGHDRRRALRRINAMSHEQLMAEARRVWPDLYASVNPPPPPPVP